jgi:hypothetical protein
VLHHPLQVPLHHGSIERIEAGSADAHQQLPCIRLRHGDVAHLTRLTQLVLDRERLHDPSPRTALYPTGGCRRRLRYVRETSSCSIAHSAAAARVETPIFA